jgi:uncharacterized damage-inducible protein DinB
MPSHFVRNSPRREQKINYFFKKKPPDIPLSLAWLYFVPSIKKHLIMTQLEAFRQELEREALTTRKMLSRVPADKFDWRPHARSMTLKELAYHVAELPTWVTVTFDTDELDFEKNPYRQPEISSSEELVSHFEKSLESGRKSLQHGKEEVLDKPWTLRSGATVYTKEPKRDIIRMSFSQIIHHRAQLGVYLRLLDVPIPGSYGPSADEA